MYSSEDGVGMESRAARRKKMVSPRRIIYILSEGEFVLKLPHPRIACIIVGSEDVHIELNYIVFHLKNHTSLLSAFIEQKMPLEL